ncbi:universal stress protein [Nocardiopsis metallicus]|uniref:Nucleotide-binding universal stress UspA family protein n=1 Tax=Nocardiopsis metallicus TaxID=179819 RepID=A0A840W9V2_9ACTN|nr:universal stress protein [Nocardiopsis metallicus]MBB5493830.1 nucleotide-binding universal stress UspA family protein [Nocardiopsis metallicus]
MASSQARQAKVIVGTDGSDHSGAALEWAAAEAVRRGVPLHIVHALGMPLIVSAYGGPTRFGPTDEISDQATVVLTNAVAQVQKSQPTLEVDSMTALEEAPLALIRQAHPGDLIVLGTRGLGTVASMFVGSVSVRVAAQAPCPVVVVPSDEEGKPATTKLDRIVVGVDDSTTARRALGLAVSLAAEADAELVVVHSWELPYPYDPVAMTAAGYRPQPEVLEQHADEFVAALIAEAMDEQRDDVDVQVTVVKTETNPVDALLEASKEADAVVVGSRGRGTVRGLLLGSVSQGILHRSKIPVVVLPKHAEESD